MILCEFKFNVDDNPAIKNLENINNSNNSVIPSSVQSNNQESSNNNPKFIEWFLLFWMICYFVDEITQVKQLEKLIKNFN